MSTPEDDDLRVPVVYPDDPIRQAVYEAAYRVGYRLQREYPAMTEEEKGLFLACFMAGVTSAQPGANN